MKEGRRNEEEKKENKIKGQEDKNAYFALL